MSGKGYKSPTASQCYYNYYECHADASVAALHSTLIDFKHTHALIFGRVTGQTPTIDELQQPWMMCLHIM